MQALQLTDISVSYPDLPTPVLEIAHLDVPAGGHLAITGPSGSGKSTFVNIVTGLERARQGRVAWGDIDITTLSESARDRWRGRGIGLVMQDFHLFPGLSALENTLLPLRLAGGADRASRERALALLARVGLMRPRQAVETMSRGEMQRVALARALMREPAILVADEPTASLDADSGAAVGDLLLELARESGATLIVVSHDMRLTERLSRRLAFSAGRIVLDSHARPEPA